MKNKELLLMAKEGILAEPDHLNMQHWFYDPLTGRHEEVRDVVNADLSACETTACVAGWIVHCAKNMRLIRSSRDQISNVAQRLLDINESLADSLFLLQQWPSDLRARYRESRRPATRARIAAERIDRFIAEQEDACAQ